MTPRQLKVLDFIRGRLQVDGVSPTYREIADHLGNSSRGNAHEVVSALVDGGYLERRGMSRRNLVLPKFTLAGVSTTALRREIERRAREGENHGSR